VVYRTLAVIAAALLAVASLASAQDVSPVSVNLGGGLTIPQSDLKDTFGTGGNFQLGVNLRVKPMFKVQAQYFYNRLASKDFGPGGASQLPAGAFTSIPLTANHSMHDGDFNLLIGPPLKEGKVAAPYGIVGIGIYHRTVNITTPSVGLATVCDPWLFICYPTPVPVDQIVGERSNTAFGFNVGAGVSLRMTNTAKFYAEFRYIHTNGPTFNDASGVSRTANGSYFPFTFGIRLHSQD
jgi:opacity protein-like surface antigen